VSEREVKDYFLNSYILIQNMPDFQDKFNRISDNRVLYKSEGLI
jgi:hypothetical protein